MRDNQDEWAKTFRELTNSPLKSKVATCTGKTDVHQQIGDRVINHSNFTSSDYTSTILYWYNSSLVFLIVLFNCISESSFIYFLIS